MSGHVYELLTEKNVHFPLKANYIEEYAGNDFLYCEDMNPEHVKEKINDFIKLMKEYGAETGKDDGIPYFILSDNVRSNYFKQHFERFKKTISEINTVTDFISKMSTISDCINDILGDCVYNNALSSMDSWFKNAEKTKYYVGNVVFIHY